AAHAHGPQHASAAGGETVEDTVVGAEDDSAGPGGGGRIDVGAGLERPEPASARREGGNGVARRRGDKEASTAHGRCPVNASVHGARPAQPACAGVERQDTATVI